MYRIVFIFLVFTGLACTDKDQPFEEIIVSEMENQSEEKTNPNALFYLALGDSYTIGESVEENQRFPVQLVEELRKEGFNMNPAKIVAQTGWTTDELAAAIANEDLKESYNIVSLLIGVNNQYRGRNADEYRVEFGQLLQTAIQLADHKAENVIVISIPDYGVTPFGQSREPEKIASEIDLFNKINLEETEKLNARYVEITGISREAKRDNALVADDGLHPSGKMYSKWVEKMLPEANEILDSQK